MLQVELPIELVLRAEQATQPFLRRSKATQGLEFAGFGTEGLVGAAKPWLNNPPGTRWLRSPHVVIGVSPSVGVEEVGLVHLGQFVTVRPTRLSRRRGAAAVSEETWPLLHDLRKTQAELSLVAWFAGELSFLVAVLLQSKEPLKENPSKIVEFDDAGNLRVRSEVLRRLFGGESLDSLASNDELLAAAHFDDALLFDVVSLSLGSPLLTRLKGYISFKKGFSIDTVIATLSLITAVVSAVPPTEGRAQPPVTCSVQYVQPSRDKVMHDASCDMYRADLSKGGVNTAQKYLTALGYPLATDGVEGPKTQAARDAFCASVGVVCTSVKSSAFQEAVVLEMAKRFPLHKAS